MEHIPPTTPDKCLITRNGNTKQRFVDYRTNKRNLEQINEEKLQAKRRLGTVNPCNAE